MKENYYSEINHLAKKLEINKRTRYLQDNSEALNTYWNIGRLIVEAQGGENRSKYGNELLKKWSVRLTKLYGKGYDYSNLVRFRLFYLEIPNIGALRQHLNWTHIRVILPIKEVNKRNYYINLCIERNLSSRELINEIKNNAYERLLNKPKKIEIIKDTKENYSIKQEIRNPIIIKLDEKDCILKEKDLQIKILSQLKKFFSDLGQGFTLVGNEYRINYGNKDYYIDLLLFNYKLNSFIVVELKLRNLRKEDKAQIEFYMNIVDNTLKESFHNKTIGVIVSKEQDRFIVSFVSEENIIPITYSLI